LITARQCAAIFEAVKPLFDLRSTYYIIVKSLLNLLDCFCFGIAKLQSYWAKCNAMSTCYSTSHTSFLGEKNTPGEAATNHARA
jgi:hypothetical protein